MAYMNDNAMDSGLAWAITNGTQLHLCSTDPTSVYATVTGNDLGNAAVTLNAITNGTVDGRKVTCPQVVISPGTGTATHWAITDNASIVVASGALSASIAVATGTDVTIALFDALTHRDAV